MYYLPINTSISFNDPEQAAVFMTAGAKAVAELMGSRPAPESTAMTELVVKNQTPTVIEPVAAEGKETKTRKTKPAETTGSTTSSADSSASSTKETKSETPPSEPEVKQEPVAEVKPDVPQLSYAEDIAKPVMALVALGQAEKIKAILGELGVASLKGSDPAIWPAAKAKLDAALAAAKAEAELA